MTSRTYNYLLLLVLSIIAFNCANRGTPTGGKVDIMPPKVTKSEPENFSTNFNSKEIKIYFNEYVKLKNLSKQLIISPPMDTEPEITPLGSSNKYIKIKIYDTLAPNTTYSFNFGNSIVDNNEENPYPFYKYVFSTGNYIDSLKVHGQISDALNRLPEEFVTVSLYEVDSTFNDSVVYKKKPKYMTSTQDSTTTFTIENIKAGRYKLIALKDKNSDNKYQQKSDKIGFREEVITVNQDSAFYNIELFKEEPSYRAFKPRLVAGEKIAFGYEGDYTKTRIKNLSDVPQDFTYRIIKEQETDTLLYFYSPKLEKDSLLFKVTNKKTIDTFTVKLKDNRKDTLKITPLNQGKVRFEEPLKLSANIPFATVNSEKIKIMDKDSTIINFTSKLDSLENVYNFYFEKSEANRYTFEALPEAFTDFFGQVNDTLSTTISTDKLSSFGSQRIYLRNATYPVFVQLVNDKNEIKYEQYITKEEPIDFIHLIPGIYYLRVLFDENNNGIYDTGNYLKHQQAERASYAKKPVEVRAGWDEVTEFKLN